MIISYKKCPNFRKALTVRDGATLSAKFYVYYFDYFLVYFGCIHLFNGYIQTLCCVCCYISSYKKYYKSKNSMSYWPLRCIMLRIQFFWCSYIIVQYNNQDNCVQHWGLRKTLFKFFLWLIQFCLKLYQPLSIVIHLQNILNIF